MPGFAALNDTNAHNYLQYELDGVYQNRINIKGNVALLVLITAPAKGKHRVWIYKATEAHNGAIVIEKIAGKSIKPLQVADASLIEFIGNSITCGAAADPSETPCGTGQYHDQHNAYNAYGPRVARAIGANYILSSVSGIGIYRYWNSDGPTILQVYEKTDFRENSTTRWSFDTYRPKMVSIALGTNDFIKGDGIKKRLPFDSAAFVSSYIKFVQLVKTKYPDAQIALLSSPMINGSARLDLQNYLTAVKRQVDRQYSSSKQVALYFFEPMQANGCGGHPSVEDHAILVAQLVPFFKSLL